MPRYVQYMYIYIYAYKYKYIYIYMPTNVQSVKYTGKAIY